jgi:isoquinoline 1-oxidoreductase
VAEVNISRHKKAQKAHRVKIERVEGSFECGAIVNRVHLHNQVEGAVVQAIGGALFERIEFKNGRILNGRFFTVSSAAVQRYAID